MLSVGEYLHRHYPTIPLSSVPYDRRSAYKAPAQLPVMNNTTSTKPTRPPTRSIVYRALPTALYGGFFTSIDALTRVTLARVTLERVLLAGPTPGRSPGPAR